MKQRLAQQLLMRHCKVEAYEFSSEQIMAHQGLVFALLVFQQAGDIITAHA